MGMLRVLTPQGDRTVVWEKESVETGDPEGLEAVRAAERIFEEQRRKGATAFQVSPNAPARKLERFDPEVDEIVVVPRVQGG